MTRTETHKNIVDAIMNHSKRKDQFALVNNYMDTVFLEMLSNLDDTEDNGVDDGYVFYALAFLATHCHIKIKKTTRLDNDTKNGKMLGVTMDVPADKIFDFSEEDSYSNEANIQFILDMLNGDFSLDNGEIADYISDETGWLVESVDCEAYLSV
jgi:hypothetical protein